MANSNDNIASMIVDWKMGLASYVAFVAISSTILSYINQASHYLFQESRDGLILLTYAIDSTPRSAMSFSSSSSSSSSGGIPLLFSDLWKSSQDNDGSDPQREPRPPRPPPRPPRPDGDPRTRARARTKLQVLIPSTSSSKERPTQEGPIRDFSISAPRPPSSSSSCFQTSGNNNDCRYSYHIQAQQHPPSDIRFRRLANSALRSLVRCDVALLSMHSSAGRGVRDAVMMSAESSTSSSMSSPYHSIPSRRESNGMEKDDENADENDDAQSGSKKDPQEDADGEVKAPLLLIYPTAITNTTSPTSTFSSSTPVLPPRSITAVANALTIALEAFPTIAQHVGPTPSEW
ncbi:MAG: hypothetical protein M1819_007407 [Sarea resinae]|nr:MAG: hypothetical protein M1819_007407 [Sarea resinae]